MKNILNKLGYMSRPALIGTVLGVATVAVGVGLVTNFSGGPKHSVSNAALEQYSGAGRADVNLSSGYSKADLEASMAMAEQQRATNSVDALKAAGSRENFAFGNAQFDNASASSAGSQDASAAYQGGGVQGMGAAASGVDAVAAGAVAEGDNSPAAQAARAQKAAAQQGAIDKANATLRTSKTMTGSTAGVSGLGASGSYSSVIPGQVASADGKATQSIPQNMAAQNLAGQNIKANAGGRVGSMGGFGVKAGGEGAGGSGQQLYSTGLSELSNASRFSKLGKKTVYGDATKGAALAEAAFDGSQTSEGVQIGEGANVAQAAGAALERSANSSDFGKAMNKVGDLATTINNDIAKAEELRGKIANTISLMFVVGSAMLMGIAALSGVKIFGVPIAAFIAAGVATVAIGIMLASIWKNVVAINSLQYGGSAGGAGVVASLIGGIMIAGFWLAAFLGPVANAIVKGTVGPIITSMIGSLGAMLGGPISGIGRSK